MRKPQHIVFGAGLIGGFLTGGLMTAGINTAIVARPRVQEALSFGLLLSDHEGNEQLINTPKFVNPGAKQKTPTANYLWLTVKCTAVEAVLEDVAKLINEDTVIICCQNGLGSDAHVRQRFPENNVLRAIVGYNVAEPKPGHLHRSTEGKLVLENSTAAKIRRIVEKVHTPLFPTDSANQFEGEQWAKLQLNLTNAVNALADIPLKATLEQRGYRKVTAELMRELLMVADAMNMELPKLTQLPPKRLPQLLDIPDWLFKLVGQKMLAIDPTARMSMWWDLSQQKPTEIDFLNGALVKKAEELGMSCPVNKAITRLIHDVQDGEESIGFSAAELQKRVLA